MLLLDEILELELGKSVLAKFHVPEDWNIFCGHFPGNPVFPGVYSVECMAQAADVLLLTEKRFAGRTPYFIGIDRVSFHTVIKPGDDINIYAEILKDNFTKAVVTCDAKIYIGETLAAEGYVTLAMR